MYFVDLLKGFSVASELSAKGYMINLGLNLSNNTGTKQISKEQEGKSLVLLELCYTVVFTNLKN